MQNFFNVIVLSACTKPPKPGMEGIRGKHWIW